MVEVFKTNIDIELANQLLSQLQKNFPDCRINFDLDDCDKILRIEGKTFQLEKVRFIVEAGGYECELLQ